MQPYYLYSDLPALKQHKVWAEIDTDALYYNYKLLCSLTKGTHHICTVKADSYGHISDICVRVLLCAGCRFFAVSCIEEAISVRNICNSENTDANIIILGYTDCAQASLLAEHDIIQSVLSEDYAKKLNESAKEQNCRVRVHVALDTGMNRIGICAKNDEECRTAASAIVKISGYEHLILEGLFTHFFNADGEYEATLPSHSQTKTQFEHFNRVRKLLSDRGITLFCHTCNSAAAVRFPEYALDGVRLGIMLYGIPPSEHIDVGLQPVMSLRTVLSHVHPVHQGESVGYGGSFISEKERKLATLPIGYADGFIRAYQGFHVTVSTKAGNFLAPIVGRICMDQCMIDVTGLPVEVGDVVTIFGKDIKDIRRLAKTANTIEYEVLCLISSRVPRIITGSILN
jgi:alanine racemase